MKSAPFAFVSPASAEEAVRACVTADGESKLVAGGQSLGPMMNLRLATPSTLVEIRRIEALRRIEDAADHHAIGAGVTHAALEDGAHPLADGGMLRTVAGGIAFRGVRNRGTIGGSLAHADPAADWVTALTALGATLRLRGPSRRRDVPMPGFMLGAFTTMLEPDELIEAVLVPRLSAGAAWGYYKICRKTGEFAEAIGAVVLDPDRGFARIVAGAMSGAPALLPTLAQRVASEGAGAATLEAAGAALAEAAPDLDRIAARLHAVAVKRALDQALGA